MATGVALVIAVEEARLQFPYVARRDRLSAGRTEALRAGCPSIDQDKFHVPPPNEKQKTESSGYRLFGGGAQR